MRWVPLHNTYQQFVTLSGGGRGGRGVGWGEDHYLLPPNQSTSGSHPNGLHKVSQHMNDSTPQVDVGVIMPLMAMAVALTTMAVAMTVGAMIVAVAMVMIMSTTNTVVVVTTQDE